MIILLLRPLFKCCENIQFKTTPTTLVGECGIGKTVAQHHIATCQRRGDHLVQMVASGRKFDVVVADPPAFAKTRKDIPAAVKGYAKLARLAAAPVRGQQSKRFSGCR